MRYLRLLSLFFILYLGNNLSAQSIEEHMQRLGFIDLQSLEPSIRVDLKYSTTDNFIGANMYGMLCRAYLEKGFAQKVAKAQRLLRSRYPNYSLLVYDAARPMSVQRRMYQAVAGTPQSIYVAPSGKGGRHNYGVAVDLTITDAQGKPLDMGTPFDYFGEEAHLGQEERLRKQGKISSQAIHNRALLQETMSLVGLRPYQKEWWHYQERIPMSEVRKRYQRLDF